ncbi:stage II sporulation protein M [Paenalkalicoccus suaedae]|uniref:Stage II sporulation protein M n=1 Tax=Paenalkalicoccus suaedae TaxID=2592382 RepID=A0A859FDR3_9BACI|nr:stage II sporulation protein M [Paenalkalicoccus suaedae]QKS71020.1 stage II sporulation protein M [Paenalkalicoccus suaedae]
MQELMQVKLLLLFLSGILLAGIVSGAVIVTSLSQDQVHYISQHVHSFFTEPATGSTIDLFKSSLSYYAKVILIIWLCGISILGAPIIILIIFLKGLTLGFSIGFFVLDQGVQGFALALAAVFPQNVFVVPVLLILSTGALFFTIRVCRHLLNKGYSTIHVYFRSYWMLFAGACVVCIVISIYESTLSTYLVQAIFNQLS